MRVSFDTHTALPLLAWELNSHFPIFLHSEKRKSGDYSFTAARIGGKTDFPVFLIPERRKAGSCTFTAVPIGGKTNFPVFLRSEGGKLEISDTLRVHMAGIFQTAFLSVFPIFCLLVGHGSGLSSTE